MSSRWSRWVAVLTLSAWAIAGQAMTPRGFFDDYGFDLVALAVSALLLLACHLFLRSKVRRNPGYTVQAVNVIARTA